MHDACRCRAVTVTRDTLCIIIIREAQQRIIITHHTLCLFTRGGSRLHGSRQRQWLLRGTRVWSNIFFSPLSLTLSAIAIYLQFASVSARPPKPSCGPPPPQKASPAIRRRRSSAAWAGAVSGTSWRPPRTVTNEKFVGVLYVVAYPATWSPLYVHACHGASTA